MNRIRGSPSGICDLTHGAIGKQLLSFALPLFIGSLIQLLYNAVDLIFVGRILGKEASAAVGSSSLIVTCILGFFTGLGAGVVAAQAVGSGQKEKLDRIIHCAAGLTAVLAGVCTVLGFVMAPLFLTWMSTPEDVMDSAVVYIRLYLLSLIAIVSYNIGSGLLRAFGNSRLPMLYQLAGGLTNVAGNTLFIYVLGWGVRGAALSTACSQGLAAFLTVRRLCIGTGSCRLRLRQICIDRNICGQFLSIGIPAAVQSIVITLSNILVQTNINRLGVDSMAAFTA
ncbi:MAG: polysaccharide biosynthesis C-terminal domain-containing protein, partial [Oscillospiraceae bacterium]|nr:polysaccharide biosynthesis C-terminal domain-containing protein [Oscillospiraceae bacterium]